MITDVRRNEGRADFPRQNVSLYAFFLRLHALYLIIRVDL